MNDYSSFLFAQPSFIEGAARILDFGDTLTEYNSSLTPEQADALAARADWNAVGADIRAAMSQFDEEMISSSDDV